MGRQHRSAALAFVTAFVTLFAQILVHRIVSAKLLNNYAFLVISLTMLGFAFSGVILSRWLDALLRRSDEVIVAAAALFALTLIGAASIFCWAGAWPQIVTSRPAFVRGFLASVPLALLYAVPFTACGLVLGLLLSSRDLSVRRIYFFDLLGSAAGAFAVIPAISTLGAEGGLLASCALLLIAAALLAPGHGPRVRRLAVLAAVVIALSVGFRGRVFKMRYPPESILALTEEPGSGYQLLRVAWDPVARIELFRMPPPDPASATFPVLMGTNPSFLARLTRGMNQNNFAGTMALAYDGTRESLAGIEETIYCAAYQATAVPSPRVAVIGVGGGMDVLTALHFGASTVEAIEVNGAIIGILTGSDRDFFGPLVNDPRVRLVHGEGRNVLATSPTTFDVIQLSGVDSFSGTPAAAHVFSESYLYTAEAFDLYLSRLGPEGILNVMRFEFPEWPREMLRALTTATGALRRAGVPRPAGHIVTVTARKGNFTAMLVKKTPFTRGELERLARWTGGSSLFALSAAPGFTPSRPNPYHDFLAAGTPAGEARFVALYPFDVAPVEDDRPFFFRQTFWWHLFPTDPKIWGSTPVMEYSLLMLFAMVGGASVLLIYLPLRWLSGPGGSPPSLRLGVFFAGLGVGYMAFEIALLQRFGLFLGHPNYALSVVLAGLLLATGLGSLLAGPITRTLGGVRFVAYAVAGVVLGEGLLAMPRLPGLLGLPFWARAAIVIGLVAPLGLLLGTLLPSGLEHLRASNPRLVPWALGTNGIFSVLGPLLAIGVSMTWGINLVLLAGVIVYLVAALSLPSRVPAPASEQPASLAAAAGGG